MGFLGDFSLYVFQEIIRIHAIKWSDHAPFKNQGLSHKLSICRFVLAGLPLDAVVAYLRKGYPVFCLGWHCDTTAIRFTNWMRFHELWPYFTDDLGATGRITCVFKIRIDFPFCGGGRPWHQGFSNSFQGKAVPIHMSYAFFLPIGLHRGWIFKVVRGVGLGGCICLSTCRVFFSFFWVGVSQLKKYIYLKKTSMFIHLCI